MTIVSVGDISVDVYASVAELPAFGEKLSGQLLGTFGGGVGANFASAAAVYGARAAALAAVGDDYFGTPALASTSACGVEVANVLIRPGSATCWNFVAIAPDGEKALTILPSENFTPRRAWYGPDAFEGMTHLHVYPSQLPEALRFAEVAREHDVPLSVDLEPATLRAASPASVEELLRRCEVVSVNEHSYAELFGDRDLSDGLGQLRELGIATVVATLGEQGAAVCDDHGTHRVEACAPGPVVDTTGAGDCFNGVFVTEWLRGSAGPDAARQASRAAGRAVTAMGSRGGYSSAEQLADDPLPAVWRLT